MSNVDATRVMGPSPAEPVDRTLVAATAGSLDPLRTQMGGTATCPVCKSTSPVTETYCAECGFLLTSEPASGVDVPEEEVAAGELVGLGEPRRYRLRAGANTIGRQGADVLLSDNTVSRVHACITIDDGGATVEDLGSTNGTKVGDRRIGPNEPVTATSGTIVKFGNWQATLELAGQTAAMADKTVAIDADAPATPVEPADQPEEAPAPDEPQVETSVADPEESLEIVARLVRIDGPSGDIDIPATPVTVGRSAENDIVLGQDPYVSGRHARIEQDTAGILFVDTGSTNGSQINGKKLQPHEQELLLTGDEVQIGQTTYRFELLAPIMDSEPADVTAGPDEHAAGSEPAE